MGQNHTQAPRSATGPCRDRRPKERERANWTRPLLRALHALDATQQLINRTCRKAAASERCASRRPMRASRKLEEAADWIARAHWHLIKAADELSELNDCITRAPHISWAAPTFYSSASERLEMLSDFLCRMADEVLTLQRAVNDGLESGELVPEPERRERRPRIIVTPRPVPVRAFLRRRQPRVVQRIAQLLRRRRRTPRPAALRVPRRSVLGRAPPSFSFCAL